MDWFGYKQLPYNIVLPNTCHYKKRKQPWTVFFFSFPDLFSRASCHYGVIGSCFPSIAWLCTKAPTQINTQRPAIAANKGHLYSFLTFLIWHLYTFVGTMLGWVLDCQADTKRFWKCLEWFGYNSVGWFILNSNLSCKLIVEYCRRVRRRHYVHVKQTDDKQASWSLWLFVHVGHSGWTRSETLESWLQWLNDSKQTKQAIEMTLDNTQPLENHEQSIKNIQKSLETTVLDSQEPPKLPNQNQKLDSICALGVIVCLQEVRQIFHEPEPRLTLWLTAPQAGPHGGDVAPHCLAIARTWRSMLIP